MNIVRRRPGAAVFEATFVFGVDHLPLLGVLSQAAQVTCRPLITLSPATKPREKVLIGHCQVSRRTDACRRMDAIGEVSRRLVDTSLLPPNLERLGTSASNAHPSRPDDVRSTS